MMGLSKMAWTVSLLLHGAMLALLIYGPSLRPTVAPPLPAGNVLDAVLVDPSVLDLAPMEEPAGPTPAEVERERREQERLDQQRQAQLEAQAKAREEAESKARQDAEDEAQRQAELKAKQAAEDDAKRRAELQARREAEDRAKRQAQLKARQEAEATARREAAAKAKREADAEAQRQAEIKAQQEAEANAKREAEAELKRQAELKAQQEAEAKTKLEADARAKRAAARRRAERRAREEELRRAMGLESQRNEAVDSGLLAQYIAQIVAKVERNWNRPPGATEGLSCKVRASQLPGGDVASVEVVECNGDAVVQRSIENAVFKASPLPEPADPTLFERNLVFIFEPK